MAYIGLRYPCIAKYTYDNESGEVTYSDGIVMGKAIEFSASMEGSSDNNLYGDDGIAESDTSFGGGTISIGTDDLSQEVSEFLLGAKKTSVQVGETSVTELIFDESLNPPYVGFGIIMPRKKDGQFSYRAVVFLRVQFSVPEESATTKGEKIEWKTPMIEGTISRSEAEGSPWKCEATVDSFAAAVAYLKQKLNFGGTSNGQTG